MRRAVVVLLLVAGVAAAAIVRSRSTAIPPTAPSEAAAPTSATVLGVDAYMRGVDAYAGEVVVAGSVQGTTPGGFELVDAGACATCPDGGCAPLVLPVRWSGALPRTGEAVQVQGRAQDERGRLLFVAASVRKGVRAP